MALACLALCCGAAQAAVAWDETVDGDFSGSGLSPTFVNLSSGANQIIGVTGRNRPAAEGGVVDRDYFTITVPGGSVLSAVKLLDAVTFMPGTGGAGGSSFIGLQAGTQLTVPLSQLDATGLLGYVHYGVGNVGSNLLPAMAAAGFGASGFSIPLAAGAYTFWVQETGVGVAHYTFELALNPVPEPASAALMLGGLLALAAAGRRLRGR